MIKRVETSFGEQSIIIETGKLAKQAGGAVWVQMGETVVLAACVGSKTAREGQDFFPLTVDYREKTYAAGKIPGGYFRREARPTEHETLTSRLIDRPLRPLFPEGFRNEVQVMLTVISADGVNSPDICAMVGASAAVSISPVPFQEPIGGVRVGYIDGKFVANPSQDDMKESKLDLILAATRKNIMMIESGANELTEEQMIEAIEFGHKAVQGVIDIQEELQKAVGKEKNEYSTPEHPAELLKKVSSIAKEKFEAASTVKGKEERQEALDGVYKAVLEGLDTEAEDFDEKAVKAIFHDMEYECVRDMILNKNERTDGRSFQEIRDISCEVGILPRAHGSALFTRGQTQSLGSTTLGTKRDEQMIESLEGSYTKRFMLHYNFPSYSVGECGRNTGPGRREIGHGALATRALTPVIPSEEDWPYTLRLVSEILESNGSSSMATVCSGSLSLMDAGVPIKAPVAGIAMGLVKEGEKWAVLTDIAGVEDHLGDMDFKVAGTTDGITALQMDIKIGGITFEIMRKALADAKEARLQILGSMNAALSDTREDVSENAPRIVSIQISTDKIRDLIGPGGKVIKKLIEETGCQIDVEQDGKVNISSSDKDKLENAVEQVKAITASAEVGQIYQGVVRRIMPFGAFCEILPGTEGLVHVSEITGEFVKTVEDHLKEGDVVKVKVLGVGENGKISLSIKQAMEELGGDSTESAEATEEPASEGSESAEEPASKGSEPTA
jgi:polyribonucleotide nucleotidyltransferase